MSDVARDDPVQDEPTHAVLYVPEAWPVTVTPDELDELKAVT